MNRIRRGTVLVARAAICLPLSAAACASPQPAPNDQTAELAIVDVAVVPMDEERVLRAHTVLVRDGRIAAVGPATSTSVPAGAVRVDGRGKFLIPGLAEMHAHIPGEDAPEQLIRDIMFLYIANGITTIRGMLGAPNQLALRDATASGEVLGPTIYVGAPSINARSAPTPEAAERLVREYADAGYDFLKVHPGPTRATYDAMAAAARARGITWAGHVPADVGIERALELRQSTIDHLDGYLEGAASGAVRARLAAGESTLGDVARAVDDDRVRMLARRTREQRVRVVPTMYLWENFYAPVEPETVLAQPEMRYATPEMREGWAQQKRNMAAQQQRAGLTAADGQAVIDARRRILKALADEGVEILFGTDSPQMFNVPGFALHHEIRVLQESGLPPFQILAAGGRNVARYAAEELELDGRFGTVAVDQRADLVLLDANPLEDAAHVRQIAGVVVGGRWLPASEIDEGLRAIAARHSQ